METNAQDIPAFQQYCGTKVSPSLWNAPKDVPQEGIIPGLWQEVNNALRERLEKSCYIPGNTIEVEVAKGKIFSNGFWIHGNRIRLCFGDDAQAKVLFKFVVNGDGRLSLSEAKFGFSKPVLASLNLKIPVGEGIGAAFSEGKCLSEATALKLADHGDIRSYDRKDSGTFTKPIILAFDTATLFPEKGASSLMLSLSAAEYLSKGWGTYAFGADEGSCEEKGKCSAKISIKRPGEYLEEMIDGEGSELGGPACRNVFVGGVIRKAIMKWIMDDWGNVYRNFLELGGGDRLLALAATANLKMNMGAGGCDWQSLKEEEDTLGDSYRRWKR